MRLIVLTPDFPPGRGGIQQLVGKLVENLGGDEVDVIALRPRARGAASVQRRGLRKTFIPRFEPLGQKTAVLLLNAAGVLLGAARRPDAMVVTHVVATPAARILRRLLGIPYVLILHGQEIPHRPRLAARAVAASHATAAVSRHARAEAERVGAPVEKIAVVNPGVDAPAAAVRKAGNNAPADRPTVVTVARMIDSYKGHDVMLEAVAMLADEVPGLRWIVIGDGPLRGEYERRAEELGVAGNVDFAGAVSDAERDEMLDAADVFAMPSRVPPGGGGEGFGLVYLEAAAHGLPCVAGAEGGALDAVVDGETGLLVDPRDAGAVAGALRTLLTQPADLARMREAARRHAGAHAWDRFALGVRRVLENGAPGAGPPRVLALSHTGAFGGAERSLLAQLRRDASTGAADVLLVSPPGALAERGARAGLRLAEGPEFDYSFKVSPLRMPLMAYELLRAGRRIAAIARDDRAAVIHANSVRAALVAVAARAFGGPPVITHVRDCLPDSTAARIVAKLTRTGSTRIVANSRYTAASFARASGEPQPKVVYNALEPQTAAPRAFRHVRTERAPAGQVFAVIGQITPWKGQDTAIRALAALRGEFSGARLVIAGSAKFTGDRRFFNRAYEESLRSLAAELGQSDAVEFTGELAEVRGLLESCDAVLMPSWEEPFGRAAIEAMAAGRAVIATSVGGPPEFIKHGCTGLLADPHDVDAWSSAMLLLARDAALRDAIGARAREDVVRRFGPESPETRIDGIYRALAA